MSEHGDQGGGRPPGGYASLDELMVGGPRAGGPRAPRRRLPAALIALISFGGLVVVLAAVYLADIGRTGGQIERNTTIAGHQVGGLAPWQARAELERAMEPELNRPVDVVVHGQRVPLTPSEAGLGADYAGAVAAAGTRSANPIAVLTSYFTHRELPLATTVDHGELEQWVTQTAASTDVRPVEGALALSGTTVTATAPVTGQRLDVPAGVAALESAFAEKGPAGLPGLTLPTAADPVRATPAGLDAARSRLATIVSGPVTVAAAGADFSLSTGQLAAAASVKPDGNGGFTVALDTGTLRAVLSQEVDATGSKPANAVVAIKDGGPVITPSVTGKAVDWQATEAAIEKAATTTDRTAPVAYTTAQPELTTEQAQALGIKEVVGEFTTSGFAYASGVNIRVVAKKVDGALISPGKSFSLNGYTGPRTVEQGYVPAGVITEGHLGTAVGGGISQFATTLFNAAYFAGMGEMNHTPHSYYISRYPAGREATVYDGVIDLGFTNDYPTGVLIQTVWTPENITVKFWGTRHVDVKSVSGDRFAFTPPPRRVIPHGQSCTPSSGTQGFSIKNTRIISDLAGKEISRDTFTTVYNGQQNVVCAPPPRPAAPRPAAPPSGTSAPPGGPGSPPVITPIPTPPQR